MNYEVMILPKQLGDIALVAGGQLHVGVVNCRLLDNR